ncbi:hypothetical protein CASFOL_041323 [Castilleja foliolosa]|uniref:Uncharacterized protein n=1 Tax=Castilleja foliolosa TaxID=1961234 RepID=A0ABD3BFT5_9LAMI
MVGSGRHSDNDGGDSRCSGGVRRRLELQRSFSSSLSLAGTAVERGDVCKLWLTGLWRLGFIGGADRGAAEWLIVREKANASGRLDGHRH